MNIAWRKERTRLVAWVREQMIGPDPDGADGSADYAIRGLRPTEAFQCGILFPLTEEGIDPTSSSDESNEPSIEALDKDDELQSETDGGNPIRYVPPSSCGFSFYVEGHFVDLEICCSAVHYILEDTGSIGQENVWRRNTMALEYLPIQLSSNADRRRDFRELDVFPKEDTTDTSGRYRARLLAILRPHGAGWLVTLSLANIQRSPPFVADSQRPWVEDREQRCLFETTLECRVASGAVGDYPRATLQLLSDEDQELAIQYRRKRVLAVGHGAGVDWQSDAHGITTIRTDFMPMTEVPSVTSDTGDANDPTLDLDCLAAIEDDVMVVRRLHGFVYAYERWMETVRADADRFDLPEQKVADRIIERMARTAERMRGGVRALEHEASDRLRRTFAVANRAMALQMRQGRVVAGLSPGSPRWRPFQLGFLLTALESTLDENHTDRDLVDLIWFPTGGGKTEAYLALVALLITWRRLNFPASGGGTTVLMRYTLRLLTGQQFERATRLIFALEHLRRTEPELGLGEEPITIGLWVGSATTPNSYRDALAAVSQGQQYGRLPRKLLLTQCPWCGTDFSPHTSFIAAQNRFRILCQNRGCAFYHGPTGLPLPCNVIDEALYDAPPTLLIGTLDKFARLAWEPRSVAFLGGQDNRPPELIIQDELHLIAGPLGSIAGVYEAALDTVLRARGVCPKYVASTATIRNAQEQTRALYAREAAVFPPPGIDEGDSWFARAMPVSDETPGRLYVGYLAPGRPKAKAIAPLAAALLAAPDTLFGKDADRDALRDAWWTLISYHSSLKGVGMAYGALDIDARDYRYFLDQKLRHLDNALPPLPPRLENRSRLQQLSGVVDVETNHQTFARLARRCDDDSEDCLDVVVATNIISVGVDVARLATMIVNGQPLTTAEYIQASSRVGRSEVPGVVWVNYYRDQVRSLSHYENFRAYHEAFYRHVEPTSVTPFAYPCRKRALHAALVIVMRHGTELRDANAVERFDPEEARQAAILDALARRCVAADPSREPGIRAHLTSLQQRWSDFIAESRDSSLTVKYSAPDSDGMGVARLLYDFDARIPGLWPTLQSMRNVEHSALVELL
jgi:hypothetical protein